MDFWIAQLPPRRRLPNDNTVWQCRCGCSGTVHVSVPLNGTVRRSGVVHHLNRNVFWKLDNPDDPDHGPGHVMTDDELLATFLVFDADAFSRTLAAPAPRPAPFVRMENPAVCDDLTTAAARLMQSADLGSADSCYAFPFSVCRPGCAVRYGDLVLCALPVDGGELRPVTLIVKAAVAAGAFSVCVVLEGVMPHDLAEPQALLRVDDAQVLMVCWQAHWQVTTRYIDAVNAVNAEAAEAAEAAKGAKEAKARADAEWWSRTPSTVSVDACSGGDGAELGATTNGGEQPPAQAVC